MVEARDIIQKNLTMPPI